jgi:hypothetical protein
MATAPSEPTKKESGDFAAFLASIRPNTNTELADELTTLVQAVKDTGKAGTLTLTLTIKPVDGSTNVVGVHDVIKVKKPERTRMGSLAYPDKNNNLSRTDPASMPLFETDDDIKSADVDLQTGEIKEPPRA